MNTKQALTRNYWVQKQFRTFQLFKDFWTRLSRRWDNFWTRIDYKKSDIQTPFFKPIFSLLESTSLSESFNIDTVVVVVVVDGKMGVVIVVVRLIDTQKRKTVTVYSRPSTLQNRTTTKALNMSRIFRFQLLRSIWQLAFRWFATEWQTTRSGIPVRYTG